MPERIDVIECAAEVEKSLGKLRWELQKEQKKREGEPEEQERKYFDAETMTFNFSNMRGTDLPYNKQIHLPKAVDEETEIRMQDLKLRLKNVTDGYVKNIKKGDNLSTAERSGLMSIKQRMKDNEIVIYETDKSRRFSVDSCENYKLSGEQHISNDNVITIEEYKEIETLSNIHAVSWVRMSQAGVAQRDMKRIKQNVVTADSHPPPLYTSRKDHNPSQSEEIGPPTRPICGVTGSATDRISYILSSTLSEVWKRNKDTVCMSTEELKAEIDRVNVGIGNRDIIVGSMDVKALYPSLDIPFTIEKVYEIIIESDLQFENFWYDEVSLYLAVNLNSNQIAQLNLEGLCHTRETNRGRPPTISSLQQDEYEKRHSKWTDPIRQPNDSEKRRLVIAALRVLMQFVMENHAYRFNGQIRKQTGGGPIGLDLTGSIAQVFMIWWDKEFRKRTESLRIELQMDKRYVDDIDVALPPVENGTRYVDGELKIVEEEVAADEVREDDEVTMELLQTVGNSIHPSIQLKIDYPSRYEDKKMPTLDLKIWVKRVDGLSRIVHEHYTKPMSTKAVLDSRSAMAWSTKRTVLTQEALRIMLNCSRELPWERTAAHLTHFSARMQYSGYEHSFRTEVIKSALHAYESLIDAERRGDRPLYRPKTWKEREREQERHAKKLNWYKKGNMKSVMFIPYTPDSTLRKLYTEEVRRSQLPIKIVERAGISLKRQLQKSDPFVGKNCGRNNCFPCTSGGKGSCRSVGINYSIYCCECEQEDGEKVYHGQSARTGFIRGEEHWNDFEHRREKSVLWKHCREKHEGRADGIKFRMDIVGVYRNDAMKRQITEAVRIRATPESHLMNDKYEYNYIRLPTASVE